MEAPHLSRRESRVHSALGARNARGRTLSAGTTATRTVLRSTAATSAGVGETPRVSRVKERGGSPKYSTRYMRTLPSVLGSVCK